MPAEGGRDVLAAEAAGSGLNRSAPSLQEEVHLFLRPGYRSQQAANPPVHWLGAPVQSEKGPEPQTSPPHFLLSFSSSELLRT